MQKTIIYIHGFRSDGASSKPQKIQKLLPNCKVVSDSFSPNPTIVIDHLNELYNEYKNDSEVIFMGTSLGGFFSMYMGIHKNCECFCINPSILSHQTLASQVGEYKTFNLEHDYHFKAEYLDVLEDLHDELFERMKDLGIKPKVIFNEDDDVIHHSLFEDFKQYFDITYYATGGHRATNIEVIIKDITQYIEKVDLHKKVLVNTLGGLSLFSDEIEELEKKDTSGSSKSDFDRIKPSKTKN